MASLSLDHHLDALAKLATDVLEATDSLTNALHVWTAAAGWTRRRAIYTARCTATCCLVAPNAVAPINDALLLHRLVALPGDRRFATDRAPTPRRRRRD